jgi:spermidine synthase
MAKAWQDLACARLPGGDVLTLRSNGSDFEIRCNLFELMSSKNPVSERALAQAACKGIASSDPHILIGGLGLGYTVRAVLDQAGPDARITVAELVPEVIEWNRGPLAPLAARPLDDARVTVAKDDVANVIRSHPYGFDAILMDVDNGPGAVLFPANRFLYTAKGVALIRKALRPNGVLGVWAADPSPDFERAVAAFRCERRDVAVPGGPMHTIYLVRTADRNRAPCYG